MFHFQCCRLCAVVRHFEHFCHSVVNPRVVLSRASHPLVVSVIHGYFQYDAGQNYKGQMIQHKDLIIQMQLPRHPYKCKQLVML